MSALTVDPKVLIGRRCFADAQSIFQGAPIEEALTGSFECGWYDTTLSPETGSFALVSPTGSLAGLAGRVIRVAAQERSVYVYVIGTAAGMDWPIALARRAFLALGLLSKPMLEATVEIVS